MKKLVMSILMLVLFTGSVFALSAEDEKIVEQIDNEISAYRICLRMIKCLSDTDEDARKTYVNVIAEQHQIKKERIEKMFGDMTEQQFNEYKVEHDIPEKISMEEMVLKLTQSLDKYHNEKVELIEVMTKRKVKKDINKVISSLEDAKFSMYDKTEKRSIRLAKVKKFFRALGNDARVIVAAPFFIGGMVVAIIKGENFFK